MSLDITPESLGQLFRSYAIGYQDAYHPRCSDPDGVSHHIEYVRPQKLRLKPRDPGLCVCRDCGASWMTGVA